MPTNLNIGIMQGRLSPKINNRIQAFPKDYWKEEFKIASESNFDSIEWIIDEYTNPIMNKIEIHEIEKLSSEFNIKINSVCCDFFMDNLLFRISDEQQRENLAVLKKLIEHAHILGIKILEIPLVDSSSIKNNKEEKQLVDNLKKIIEYAEEIGIIIGLETDFPSHKIIKLLENFESENIALNYDTGNSASLGFNPKEELTTLEKYIKNIHIKDRKFDVIFTKSVIEHISDPTHLMKEILRILKPGGIFISLTPEWNSQMKTFYDDPTHIHPYQPKGLKDLLILSEFKEVHSEIFYYHELLWKSSFWRFFASILRKFISNKTGRSLTASTGIKLFRWGVERQILGYGYK